MEKQYFKNIFFTFLLLASTSLTSCNNNDLKEEYAFENRIIAFNVSQNIKGGPDELSRADIEKTDTIYQKFKDGMILETVVELDKTASSRDYLLVDGDIYILAIVITESNTIYSIQELRTDSGGKLCCRVPNVNVRVIFYSYNSTTKIPHTTLKVGDNVDIDTKNNTEYYDRDVMHYDTGIIRPDFGLESERFIIRFEHLFSRVRIHMESNADLMSFTAMLKDYSYASAKVDIISGKVEPVEDVYASLIMSARDPHYSFIIYEPRELFSPYSIFIPRDDATTYDLYLNEVNDNQTTRSTTITKDFKPGYSYTINVKLRTAQ
ncbi:MAG: fimbrillin family protein [Bacteroides sp.]|nr:fimbrillin family protein [Bacteroides sp.]